MKKANILYSLLSLLLVMTTMSSCKKDQEIGGTAVQELSGEWWVTADDGGGATDYFKISTYNTAANIPTEMWIDDAKNFYGLKAKIKADVANKTFSATDADELYFGVTVTITDGKVIKDAATASGTGNKTDSIYFKAEYSDDPGTIYTYSGYKRTRFSQDDH
ncbi:MAG TPA: lipid-binding protein [Pedobacter sp.]|uniref:lipid-binding protein n=1 Tax=Pedobacter sp. TaxID=1411316 RepID=UPI002BE8783E|nr:lipid-binding protein [Pedobacter sp.]HMI02518.1 lipid-binding protein [Pedobacter sp.]